MSDLLILMRHGKAQRPSEGMLDIERKLTEAGKRSLAATLPTSLGLMPRSGARIEVWSSPAARAEQTARILVKACRQCGIETDRDLKLVDVLWNQDADAFVETVRQSEADAVIAVGHNPFIEELTYRLSGSRIDFATGGLAAISLSSETTGADGAVHPGRLLWFAQGPVSQRWKTLVSIERVIGDASDTVQERLAAFFENPDDVETMHKFRVSIRTLRSLLAFVEPWQDAKQNADSQRKLKEIVAETSHLRELDVLCGQAKAMHGASDELIVFCESEAQAERERVMKALSSKRVEKRLGDATSELHDIKWRKRVSAQGLDAADVRSRFDEVADKLRDDLETLDISDAERTHDVRKSAKRVRYDAEKFQALIGEDAVDIAKSMTAHQDNLGAICDARVNIDMINDMTQQPLSQAVAWDLALLRAQNETYLYSTLRNA